MACRGSAVRIRLAPFTYRKASRGFRPPFLVPLIGALAQESAQNLGAICGLREILELPEFPQQLALQMEQALALPAHGRRQALDGQPVEWLSIRLLGRPGDSHAERWGLLKARRPSGNEQPANSNEVLDSPGRQGFHELDTTPRRCWHWRAFGSRVQMPN